MIDPHEFAQKQLELTAEFGKYVFDHPEMDSRLPDGAYVYFQVRGEREFNAYSRALAQKRQAAGRPAVLVHIQGLAKPQRSRLLKPRIAFPGRPGIRRSKSRAAVRRRMRSVTSGAAK